MYFRDNKVSLLPGGGMWCAIGCGGAMGGGMWTFIGGGTCMRGAISGMGAKTNIDTHVSKICDNL